MEHLVEWQVGGETEVFEVNLHQFHFVNHKSHMTWPELERGTPRWEAWAVAHTTAELHSCTLSSDVTPKVRRDAIQSVVAEFLSIISAIFLWGWINQGII
jgi:hypothetical protein